MKKEGFTIVELVIVIAVIAVLATVLVPAFGEIVERAKAAVEKQNERNESISDLIDGILGTEPEKIPLQLTLTPETYLTVSRPETEKLSCAPGMVHYGDGRMAVAYLADDTNKIETEDSTTIVCRLGLFSLEDPENGEYIDIATAGQTIGDMTIGSKAPYEPNLLKRSEAELLILFNIRDTAGKYVYCCARFDAETKRVTAYEKLKLDGSEWTPATIADSYNRLSERKISAAGPTGSMVFTSGIIRHEGWFYGYCGGVCDGFAGILVRSADGVNWESVLTPEAAPEMEGVIECGFDFFDGCIYLCVRDIKSGVYHTCYEWPGKEPVTPTEILPGLTTSKPVTFRQDGSLYLIVNQETGDFNTVGRRNTALFYRINPRECSLTLVKRVFCKDGCAYHSVVNVNNTNYWCFHTDARRIEPFTQGRSNLAFLEIPPLSEGAARDGTLELSGYVHCFAKGCITTSTTPQSWQSNAVNYHYQIPLSDFADFDNVTVTANGKQKAYIAFFTKQMTTDKTIAFAEGWSEVLILNPGASVTLEIPNDAAYLYILNNNGAGDSLLPQQVVFGRKDS